MHLKKNGITKKMMKQLLPESPIIVEAGAHKGRDTIKMVQWWPKATIYAFEPLAHLFALLVESVKNRPNILCYQLALSDTIGRAPMYVSSGISDAASSLLKPKGYLIDNPLVIFSELMHVATTTLDQWAQDEAVALIDFLWLDMQGYELLALKASPIMISKVKVIYTEVNLDQRYEGNVLYPELKEWLMGQGFFVYQEDIFRKNWGNALFVKDFIA